MAPRPPTLGEAGLRGGSVPALFVILPPSVSVQATVPPDSGGRGPEPGWLNTPFGSEPDLPDEPIRVGCGACHTFTSPEGQPLGACERVALLLRLLAEPATRQEEAGCQQAAQEGETGGFRHSGWGLQIVPDHVERRDLDSQGRSCERSGESVLHLRIDAGREGIALPVAEVAAIVLVVELRQVRRTVDGEEGLRGGVRRETARSGAVVA